MACTQPISNPTLNKVRFARSTQPEQPRYCHLSNNLLAVIIDLVSHQAMSGSSSSSGDLVILKKHRHRYEISPVYVEALTSHGLHFVGKSEDGNRMGMMEIKSPLL